MKVFSDLKSRGCQDILIAVTDGLKGMTPNPEPRTEP
jgi:transposase-like protein